MKAMIYSGKGNQQESLKIADTSLAKPNPVLVSIEVSSLNIIDFERFKIPMEPSFFAHVINFFQGRKGFPLLI